MPRCSRSPTRSPAIRKTVRRRAGDRDRAGVRLHGGRARPDDAQRTLPACGHERHRAERRATSPPSRPISRNTRSRCSFYNSQVTDPQTDAAAGARQPGQRAGRRRDRDRSPPARPSSGLDAGAARRNRKGAGRTLVVSAIALEHVTPRDRRPNDPRRRHLRDRRGRVHRRARAERRRQDHADARHPRPAAGRRAGTIRVLGQPARRGNPADRLPAADAQRRCRSCGSRGRDFVASGDPRPALRPALARRARAGANSTRRWTSSAHATICRPAVLRDVGRRAPAPAASRRRLIGRPRMLLLDEPLISLDPQHQQAVVELARQLSSELRHHRAVQRARAQPAARRARPRALSRQRPGGARHRRRGHHRAGAVAALWLATIEVVRADGHIFVMSGGLDVERDPHLHDHDDGHEHRAPWACLTTTSW